MRVKTYKKEDNRGLSFVWTQEKAKRYLIGINLSTD